MKRIMSSFKHTILLLWQDGEANSCCAHDYYHSEDYYSDYFRPLSQGQTKLKTLNDPSPKSVWKVQKCLLTGP